MYMRNQNNETLIIKAIGERKVITFDYKSDADPIGTMRSGNPHAMYEHLKTGNVLLDLFQTEGQSSERYKLPVWREFKVDKMSNIRIMDNRNFETQKNYNPNAEKYLRAIAKIR